MSTHDSLCAIFSPPEDESVYKEHFVNTSTFHRSTRGEGTSEVHLCRQTVASFNHQKSLWQESDFTYQVCFLLSTDDGKRAKKRKVICSENILLSNIHPLRKSPLSISVCLLIACYTVQQDHVEAKHPGYECLLTNFLGCAELWASLVTAVLLSR